MTPEDLARLHAVCFTDAPRPWSAEEFSSLIAQPETRLVAEDHGFALIRFAGYEAELLTLAVDPAHRRQGIARRLLHLLETVALETGSREVILEVAETNTPARALYLAAGFTEAGLRKNYYASPRGPRTHALVLKKVLG